MQLVIGRYEVRTGLVAALRLVLLVVTVYHGLVADAAHQWHEDLQVAVLTADLLFEPRLKEGIELFKPHLWLALAVKDAQEVELVNAEGQLRILLETFFLSEGVRLVLENDEDVVLHE